VLEVGFGSGSNLWFAAREGFSVHGIEASQIAVEQAIERFKQEKLVGDFRQGDFVSLPFESCSMDLAIDRAALTLVGRLDHKLAIKEVHRVLKDGGMFHYNVYADSHSSCRSGICGEDGARVDISEGTLVGVGQVLFLSRTDIDELFNEGWKLHQVQRREWTEMLNAVASIHAEWLVVAEKVS